MFSEFDSEEHRAAILNRLATVLDPELDQSIVELGFVQSIRVRNRHAEVLLQLPTSWCAVNFAFVMAEDVRLALLMADVIEQVTIRLGDHCAAAEIEAAINEGKPFSVAFPVEGAGSLRDLRTTFLRKGFLARQERLLQPLLESRASPEQISALRVNEGPDVARPEVLQRYLDRRAELGLDCSPSAPLIVDQSGLPIGPDQLQAYYHQIRTIRVAMEANGSFCRALLAKRSAPVPSAATNRGEAHVQA